MIKKDSLEICPLCGSDACYVTQLNATAKNYHQAYLASQERVKELVHAYNLYGAKPNQVHGRDASTTGMHPEIDAYYM